MTRPRTFARPAALAAALATTALLLLPSTASASATVTDVSWWTRNPLAAPPEGGFGVGAAPDGATTVAAIGVDVADGVETLVLTAAPAGEVAGLAALEVCVAPGPAGPSTGDAIEEAPVRACEGEAVPFGRAGDAWRADVSSLVAGATGTVTLAVVPAAGSGTVPYEVAFAAPSVRATGAAAPASDGGTGTPPATTPPARAGGGTAAPAPPAVRLDPITTPAPNRSTAVAAPTTTAAPADPATAPAGDPGAADDEAGSAFELATGGLIDAEASAPRWGEALLLVVIGVAVGAVVYGGSRFAEARG